VSGEGSVIRQDHNQHRTRNPPVKLLAQPAPSALAGFFVAKTKTVTVSAMGDRDRCAVSNYRGGPQNLDSLIRYKIPAMG
jgi:hypothetical protein